MSKNILVIGSCNQDITIKVAELPTKGKTIIGSNLYYASGGKGANQAVAAAKCGGKVKFLACVGDDSAGKQILHGYAEQGVDTSCIQQIKNANTGTALITVDQHGNNTIAIVAGANAALTAQVVEANKAVIMAADYVLLQLENPLAAIYEAIAIAHAAGAYVVLNPAPAQTIEDEIYSQLDLITPNEIEAEQLTGITVHDEQSATQAAQVFIDKGVKEVVITLGEKGIYYHGANLQQLFPCFKVEAVDATAAGDTFNGALLAALANNEDMQSALRFAQAASAISVTCLGAQPSIPQRQAVIDFLTDFEL